MRRASHRRQLHFPPAEPGCATLVVRSRLGTISALQTKDEAAFIETGCSAILKTQAAMAGFASIEALVCAKCCQADLPHPTASQSLNTHAPTSCRVLFRSE